jgi:hypothetical protein
MLLLVAGIGTSHDREHCFGVVCFFGFILSGYQAALPADVVDTGQER